MSKDRHGPQDVASVDQGGSGPPLVGCSGMWKQSLHNVQHFDAGMSDVFVQELGILLGVSDRGWGYVSGPYA